MISSYIYVHSHATLHTVVKAEDAEKLYAIAFVFLANTSRNILHEYFEQVIFNESSVILNNVFMSQMTMKSYFFLNCLHLTAREKK